MTPAQRRVVALAAGAFAIGGLGNLLLGHSPEASVPQLQPEAGWAVPAPDVPDLVVLDKGWEARAPWGARPKPPEVAPPPPPPPAAPVGIVRGPKGRQEVIFLAADVGTVRVAPGESLPGGGRLLRVSGMRVTWLDRDGKEQQREMFIDPPPVLPIAAGGAAMGAAMAMPAASAPTLLQRPGSNRPGGAQQGAPARSQSPRGTRSGAQPGSGSRADAAMTTPPPAAASDTAAAAAAAPGTGTVTTVSAQSLRRPRTEGQTSAPASSQAPGFGGERPRPPGAGSRQRQGSSNDAQRPGQ